MPSHQLPYYIKNFSYLGVPPQNAHVQMLQIWHLEYALRHYVWARLRMERGDGWTRHPALRVVLGQGKGPRGFLELQRRRDCAVKSGEYPGEPAPNPLWFASLGELSHIIRQFRPLDRSFESAVRAVSNCRNRWAHFRPADPRAAEQKLGSSAICIEQRLSKWMAEYWDADSTVNGRHWLVRRYHESQQAKGTVPLLTTPIPGVHGGFLDPKLPLDRGWSMLLRENHSCYWVELAAVGCRRNFGIDELRTYGTEMQDLAIHVAMCFDEDERVDLHNDGFYMLRVSFSKADDQNLLLRAFRRLSDITKRLPLSVSERSDKVESLTKGFVLEQLFYRAPWNVIVAPPQEYRISFTVRTQ